YILVAYTSPSASHVTPYTTRFRSIARYSYFGVPMRLNVVAGPVVMFLHFDWNWLGHADHPAPKEVDQKRTTYEVESGALPWRLRSEEHTSELQSREKLVCRLLLEK